MPLRATSSSSLANQSMAEALSKRLTKNDLRRLCVPKEWWNIIGPLFGEDRSEIELRVVDEVGMFWEFRCAVRRSGEYKKPVLQSDGWVRFVDYKGLEVGDMVILETVEDEFRGTRFKLRALKFHAGGHD